MKFVSDRPFADPDAHPRRPQLDQPDLPHYRAGYRVLGDGQAKNERLSRRTFWEAELAIG